MLWQYELFLRVSQHRFRLIDKLSEMIVSANFDFTIGELYNTPLITLKIEETAPWPSELSVDYNNYLTDLVNSACSTHRLDGIADEECLSRPNKIARVEVERLDEVRKDDSSHNDVVDIDIVDQEVNMENIEYEVEYVYSDMDEEEGCPQDDDQ